MIDSLIILANFVFTYLVLKKVSEIQKKIDKYEVVDNE